MKKIVCFLIALTLTLSAVSALALTNRSDAPKYSWVKFLSKFKTSNEAVWTPGANSRDLSYLSLYWPEDAVRPDYVLFLMFGDNLVLATPECSPALGDEEVWEMTSDEFEFYFCSCHGKDSVEPKLAHPVVPEDVHFNHGVRVEVEMDDELWEELGQLACTWTENGQTYYGVRRCKSWTPHTGSKANSAISDGTTIGGGNPPVQGPEDMGHSISAAVSGKPGEAGVTTKWQQPSGDGGQQAESQVTTKWPGK